MMFGGLKARGLERNFGRIEELCERVKIFGIYAYGKKFEIFLINRTQRSGHTNPFYGFRVGFFSSFLQLQQTIVITKGMQ